MNPIDPARARGLLAACDLSTLFVEELGWNRYHGSLSVEVDGETFALTGVAEKCGMAAFLCAPDAAGRIPDSATRRKIERLVAGQIHEHLIVFTDTQRAVHVWQWVRRERGRPTACREHRYDVGQPGDSLIQKLSALAVSLEDEESLTLPDVTGKARRAFDVERVTKRFYELFRDEHKTFLGFLQGIPDTDLARWYVSVMLNRLMFVYFIQKKGFLAGDADYLKVKLAESRHRGADRYYRTFLCPLFFEGFAKRAEERSATTRELLGEVPYLNGGIFLPHQIEKLHGRTIEVPDAAFDRLFAFFDAYRWHLDERPCRRDDEINPDVLGYIFEKYVNQKQMGAYYTKEDITDYIGKNTILPFLLDAVRERCKVAFEGEHSVWRLLRDEPDRCIYPAVRHGLSWDYHAGKPLAVPLVLPPEIAVGLEPPTLHEPVEADGPVLTLELRKGWNRPAPAEFALPTETWREVVARRQRYWELLTRLTGRRHGEPGTATGQDTAGTAREDVRPPARGLGNDRQVEGECPPEPPPSGASGRGRTEPASDTETAGPVTAANDLITLNLDIRQFAQDVVETCEGPELLAAFWRVLCELSVLDPTCGSGAFLFAALNILEPLYQACLDRMQFFLAEWGEAGRKQHPNYWKLFTETLARVEQHPSRSYYVLKSTMVNNLYGVDIMEEATEICKLRLFLKLVAQIDRVEDLAPLPDIDFNIRAGNTLVGFVSLDEVRKTQEGKLGLWQDEVKRIEEDAGLADLAFRRFRQMQTEQGMSPRDFAGAKADLAARLKQLTDQLDRYLAGEYGIDSRKSAAFDQWRRSHQPFHWFAEFYGILHQGGFQVIIGNPPYVEYKDPSISYAIRAYETEECGNLYAYAWERSIGLACVGSRLGLIIPVASVSTGGYESLRRLWLCDGDLVVSCFSDRPGKLFEGLEHIRLAVVLLSMHERGHGTVHTTGYCKWRTEARDTLFAGLGFSLVSNMMRSGAIPKMGTDLDASVWHKVSADGRTVGDLVAEGGASPVYYTRKLSWFVQVLDFVPAIRDDRGALREPSELKALPFRSAQDRDGVLAVLNSTLFYWFLALWSDCRNLNSREVIGMPVGTSIEDRRHRGEVVPLARRLAADVRRHSRTIVADYKKWGRMQIQCVYPKHSKPIIDEIDQVLARHYGFTEEELDFIINYDIKYRMGQDSGEEEGD